MRVLITGHRGFVGRHLRMAYVEGGHQVTGIDIAPDPRSFRSSPVCDARDFFQDDDIRYDLVLHCAAVVGGRTFIDGRPFELAVEDLSIDAALFRWAMRTKPGRIVFFSSSAAYPIRRQQRAFHHRLKETHIDLDASEQPDSMYGWVKLTGEQLARHAHQVGLDVTVLRPFSGYGSDQDLTYPFPAIMKRIARRDNPVVVWGDGEQVRDWVHIDDVVGMVQAVVEAKAAGPFNIGTGRATSFREMIRLAAGIAGYDPDIEPMTNAPTGVDWRVADTSLSHRIYVPQVPLEVGIERALRRLEGE